MPKYIEAEKKFSGKYSTNMQATIWAAYSPYIGKMFLFLALGVFGRLSLLANTNIIGFWIDSFCKQSDQCKPPPLWISHFVTADFIQLLLILSTIGFISTLIFRVGFSRVSAQAISQLYDEVTLRTSRFPIHFFDTTPTGRIITRFSSDYGTIFRLFGGPLAEFLAIIFDLIVMIILITVASPIFLILVVFIALINYLIYVQSREGLRKERRELSHSRSPSIAHFAETAQGASSIRAYLRQPVFINRFKILNDHFLNQKLKTLKKLIFFSFKMNSLTVLLFLITGLCSYFFIHMHWVSIGSIGVAFTFIAMAGNTVQMFFDWLAQFEEGLVGLERLDQYLRNPIEPGLRIPSSSQFATDHWKYSEADEDLSRNQVLTKERSCSVEIKDLWFRYNENLPWVLKGVNLFIKPGERIGIIGKTGSGKSTLVQALFYLYEYQKGLIQINHCSPQLAPTQKNSNLDNTSLDSTNLVNLVDLQTYRKSIAWIAQDPTLFKGTLGENLSLHQTTDRNRLLQVLELVGLKDWALGLPNEFNYLIEERGKNLSLGERQLLCLARCLLQDAPVVIMDEATSNVDPQSEEIMVKATEEFFKGRTQIIIAHRLSTLNSCDRILWLHDGEIRALGTPAEVLSLFKEANLHEALT
jgi:ABC-type multidrug transport system fused ATPase/permease subunit